MSDVIRQLRYSITADPNFDREGFLRSLHTPDMAEEPAPPPSDDYERMRQMHADAMVPYGNYGTRDSGRAGLYHRARTPRFPGYVGPADIKQKVEQAGGYWTYPGETPAPQ
jgi:hypothetical protein